MRNLTVVVLAVLLWASVDRQQVLAGDEKPVDPPVKLEPFVVSADSLLSFGFSLRIVRQEPGDRLVAMYVERVLDGSDAALKGLEAGSEVLSVDGRDVHSYEATFRKGSELNRIFVGRAEGARVMMEVRPMGKTKKIEITIVRRTVVIERPKIKIGGVPFD